MPGTHEIGFDSAADTITLTHTARSREGFARGALRAARWIAGKKGFFDFREIVNRDRMMPITESEGGTQCYYRMRYGAGHSVSEGFVTR